MDTFLRTNRLVLLVGTVVCMLLPLVSFSVTEQQFIQRPILAIGRILAGNMDNSAGTIEKGIAISVNDKTNMANGGGEQASILPLLQLGEYIYFIGAGVVLLFFLLSTVRMFRFFCIYPKQDYGKYKLIICPEKVVAFSWGNTVVLSQEDYNRHFETIVLHEQMHLQHHHTLDLLWMECLLIIHWFNPAVWLLIRELKEIHEYQADSGVINHGIDATQYQLLLVKKSVGTRLYSMACGFNHSKLKKRINMMLKRKTNNWARLKLLLFVPVAAGTLYAFAQPEVKRVVEQVVPSQVSVSDTLQVEDMELLKQFFARKYNEALRSKTGEAALPTKHLFFVNIKNQMMLDDNRIGSSAELKTALVKLLKEDYRTTSANGQSAYSHLEIHYDRGSGIDAIRSYLMVVKSAYLTVRAEIAAQLKDVDEAHLDAAFPILVTFGDPKHYGVVDQNIPLPIQITLFYPDGKAPKELKEITLNELRRELKVQMASTDGKPEMVGLKVERNCKMGSIIDVKELLREMQLHKISYSEQ